MVVDGCGWFWVVLGGCGWLWMVVGSYDLLWVVVDGCGWLWMNVDGCGWLWVVVGGCGWLWAVVSGCILSYNPFIFCFLFWKSFFTGQLALSAFTCYFENFVMPTLKSNAGSKIFPCACTDWGILKTAEVKEKEELTTMLKLGKISFDVILDRDLSHTWKIRSI